MNDYDKFLEAKHKEYIKVKDQVPENHVDYLQKKSKGFFTHLEGFRVKPSAYDIEACTIVASRRSQELTELLRLKHENDKKIEKNTPTELLQIWQQAKLIIPSGDLVSVKDFLKLIGGYGWEYKFVNSVMIGQDIRSVDFLSPKQLICMNKITQKIFKRDFAEIRWED
jgi:hypothetical protein